MSDFRNERSAALCAFLYRKVETTAGFRTATAKNIKNREIFAPGLFGNDWLLQICAIASLTDRGEKIPMFLKPSRIIVPVF